MAFIIGTSTTNTQILAAGTTAERPATPSAGQMRYNSTDLAFEAYSGTSWSQFGQGYGSYTITGLFIHYDFSNPTCYSGSGTAVVDLMGTQGGTITGATFGGSNLAKYLSFTGNGTTYVQMGSSIPASQSTSAFTLEAWIYTTAMSGTNTTDGIGAIISSQNDSAGYRGASINTDTRSAHGGGPNGYHPQVGTGSGWATTASGYNTGSGTAAVSNRWDHIAYTWSSGSPLRVYENGSLLAADTTNFSGTVNWSSTYWALGRQLSNSAARAYTGYIAIARIYNNALSASDVLYNYNGQKSRFGL